MQMAFDGMPPRGEPCPWCHEDPCTYGCEEVVAYYEEMDGDERGRDSYTEEDYARFIREREEVHRRLGVPMWGYTPLGRSIETVKTGIVL